MNILLLSYKFSPDVGGIEVNSELLANYFTRFGATVHVVTTTQRDDSREFSFKVLRKPSFITLFKEYLWADVVFENNPVLHLSWPITFFRKPHVVAIRTWISRMDGSSAIQDKIKKNWVKRADSVIAVSKAIEEHVSGRTCVIGNPYRSDLFVDLPDIPRDRDFVYIGRLVSDKGVDMAVELIKLLHIRKKMITTLTVIGDGPDMSYLKELVDKYELSEYIRFSGILRGNDLVQCINEHRYVLVPSRWKEPFGNVALEGMACGCIPIVSDGGGLPDAVGNAGVVFERNDVESLYEKALFLLENPGYEADLKQKLESQLDIHKPEKVAGMYYDVIKEAYRLKQKK